MDYGQKMTDKELAVLERRIAKVYSEASKDLKKTIDEYFSKFVERDKAQKKLLEDGKITEEQYKQWRLNQIGRGERFKDLQKKVAERCTKANEVAVSYVNDKTPNIYSLNRNYGAYEIESVAGNVGFTLWDEQTVKRLIVEEPDLMPYYPKKRALNRGIDLAYGKRQISAQVTSSILMGYSIGKIANGLQDRMISMNRASAIRTARTAVTGAQNAGRQDSYVAAEKMGIQIEKEWLATLDNRTRHSHSMIDGEKAPVEGKFSNGCRFPGDPQGKPWEVYNCRCTLVAKVKGISDESGRMTYPEWEKGKTLTGQKERVILKSSLKDDDIIIGKSLGSKAKNYEVMDLETRKKYPFVEGTKIQNVEVFAGKGTKVPYRQAWKYANAHGGREEDWQHVKGFGWLETEDGEVQAEVHWSQCEGIGKHDFFVKRWMDE